MRRTILSFALLAVLAGALLTVLTTTAQSDERSQPAADRATAGLLPGSAYWTPERMRAAEPRSPAAAPSPARASADTARASGTVPFERRMINDTERYPHRAIGRVFGTYPDGDFSCSGSVVSSRSESVIVTAGHCALDVGGTDAFARNLMFVPGYDRGSEPFGRWEVSHLVTAPGWARHGDLDQDLAFMRISRDEEGRPIQQVVGSLGLGFRQPRRGRVAIYGYPASGGRFDGERMVRCRSRMGIDRRRDDLHRGPHGVAAGCDMQEGASGAPIVIQRRLVASVVSHGHPPRSANVLFGPYFGRAAIGTYRFRNRRFPSIGPITCRGRPATLIGTELGDLIRGSARDDVIHGLGGPDRLAGGAGNDLICGGAGNDRLFGGRGNDVLDGGPGRDRCDGGLGRDRAFNCRIRRRVG